MISEFGASKCTRSDSGNESQGPGKVMVLCDFKGLGMSHVPVDHVAKLVAPKITLLASLGVDAEDVDGMIESLVRTGLEGRKVGWIFEIGLDPM